MSWWEDFQKAVADGLAAADRSTKAEVEPWFVSGATTPAEAQAAIDKKIAAVQDDDVRASLVERAESARADLIATLVGSGYEGDVDKLSNVELAKLVGELESSGLRGSATPIDDSAKAAAAAAQLVGGNVGIDERTGAVVIYGQDGKVHERIAPGGEGRPAKIVAGEIMIGSERGGPRPIPEDIQAAFDALLDAGWDPRKPGDAGVSFEEDGDVVATFPDGSTRRWQHDDARQTLADLEASAGSIPDIGRALDRGATSFGLDALGNFNRFLGSLGIPGFDWGMGGGGSVGGTGGGGTGTGGSNGGGSGSNDGGSGGPTTTGASGGSSDDLETWTGGDTGDGGKPSDDDDDEDGDDPPAPGEPASTQPNEIVERHPEDDGAEGGEEDDGWAPSTIDPPTDSTYVDTDGDGVPDDEENDPPESSDSAGDSTDDDDDEEDEDEDSAADADPDAEYTPAPEGEGRKVPTEEDLERLAAAAAARGDWYDRPPLKVPEYDPDFAARLQQRKLGMIGNPGDPDLDAGSGGGTVPDDIPIAPDPDDDTPGHDTDGADKGEEDPTQQGGPQVPLDPSIVGNEDDQDDQVAPLAPQETVAAELDGAMDAPLQATAEAEVNIEGTPSVPGYHYAIGDPVGNGDEPADGSADGDADEIAAIAGIDRDARLGGELSIPAGFKPPSRDAEDDDAAAG